MDPVAGERSITVRCPAKLNLFLEVLGKRPDGYHEIETVLTPAPMVEDEVTASIAPYPGVSLTVEGGARWGVPDDRTNLAWRAAELVLGDARASAGIHLRLRKEIPPGAGLGGGSSDAAATLRAVNRLLGDPLPPARLAALALSLGSDVPYFLEGGTVLARGRGEVLARLPDPPPFLYWVQWPGVPAPTDEVYARCRPAGDDRRDASAVVRALAARDAEALDRACFNRLEAPSREVCPAVGEALELLRGMGDGRAHVSGSGSSCFLVLGNAAGECAPSDWPLDRPAGAFCEMRKR